MSTSENESKYSVYINKYSTWTASTYLFFECCYYNHQTEEDSTVSIYSFVELVLSQLYSTLKAEFQQDLDSLNRGFLNQS